VLLGLVYVCMWESTAYSHCVLHNNAGFSGPLSRTIWLIWCPQNRLLSEMPHCSQATSMESTRQLAPALSGKLRPIVTNGCPNNSWNPVVFMVFAEQLRLIEASALTLQLAACWFGSPMSPPPLLSHHLYASWLSCPCHNSPKLSHLDTHWIASRCLG